MKKIALGIGIVLIVALASVWVYLLFFNTNNGNSDVFSLFGFGDTTDTSVPLETSGYDADSNDTPVVDVFDNEPLRQLTTRPVIGYREVQQSDSNATVYFVEAGTGHIYTIDLSSGQETRISNITVPAARQAVISKDGNYAAIRSGDGFNSEMILVTLPFNEKSLDSKSLPEASDNFVFSDEGVLLYSLVNNGQLLGKTYNLSTNSIETLFTVPFQMGVVDWGETVNSTHYVYPKPSYGLQGFLYQFNEGQMKRLSPSGYGFSAQTLTQYGLYTTMINGSYSSYLYNVTNDYSVATKQAFLPDKCNFIQVTDKRVRGVCAIAQNQLKDSHALDDWYSGQADFSDSLWVINMSTRTHDVAFLLDLEFESGRKIDAINLNLSKNNRLLFTNRNDMSLWLYENNLSN